MENLWINTMYILLLIFSFGIIKESYTKEKGCTVFQTIAYKLLLSKIWLLKLNPFQVRFRVSDILQN